MIIQLKTRSGINFENTGFVKQSSKSSSGLKYVRDKTVITVFQNCVELTGHDYPLEQYVIKSGDTVSSKIIGSDETLKGDTFGGMVVAAVEGDQTLLKELGVKDSKAISAVQVHELAKHIKQHTCYCVISIDPYEYNVLFDKVGSVTKILDLLHTRCYTALAPGKHIVDKYPGCTAGHVCETHAESKYPVVAAASILARDAAVEQIRNLSKQAGFNVPLGSTHVHGALCKIVENKLDPLRFVKLHFKNVRLLLGQRSYCATKR